MLAWTLLLVNELCVSRLNRLKDGRELKESPRIKFDCRTIRDDEVSLSLYLTESEIADVGEFKVVARNSEGEASDSATLTVNSSLFCFHLSSIKTDLLLGFFWQWRLSMRDGGGERERHSTVERCAVGLTHINLQL